MTRLLLLAQVCVKGARECTALAEVVVCENEFWSVPGSSSEPAVNLKIQGRCSLP